jgi:hypothetical protein
MLWLRSSSRYGVVKLATRSVIELSSVNAASIVALDCAVLEIPFIDQAGSVHPSRTPPAGYRRLRTDAFGVGKSRQRFWWRNIPRDRR